MNETDLQQILNMVNGAPFGNAGPQPAPPQGQNWMQWLSGGLQGQTGSGGSGGGKNLSGMGTALAGSMGMGPLAGL